MDLKIETPVILTKIVAQLFEVVLQQQHFASVYAMFCREVSRALTPGQAAPHAHATAALPSLHCTPQHEPLCRHHTRIAPRRAALQ